MHDAQSKLQARRTCDGITAANRARSTDRKAGRVVLFPVRYADDFMVLVRGTQQQAEAERELSPRHCAKAWG